MKRTHRLPPGDFPDLERFKETLKDHDFDTFAKLDEKLVSRIDDVLGPYLLGKHSFPTVFLSFRWSRTHAHDTTHDTAQVSIFLG